MKEAFYEESAKCAREKREAKIYLVFSVFAVVSFVIAGIHALFSLTYVSVLIAETEGLSRVIALVQWFGLLVMLIVIGLVFFLLRKRFNVSYDYIFVEDELRVSKVFNGKKRKHILTLKGDQILKIGMCDKDSFERTCAGLPKKAIRFLTPNQEPCEGKSFYYILYSTSIEKAVYVIEAREMMLNYLVFAAGRNKLEMR